MGGELSSQVAEVVSSLRDYGAEVFISRSGSERPLVIATHHTFGVVASDEVENGSASGEAIKILNRKIALLRSDIPDVENLPMARLVIDAKAAKNVEKIGDTTIVIGPGGTANNGWLHELPRVEADIALLDRVCGRLSPALIFQGASRTGAPDLHRVDRALMRFILDEEQGAAAQLHIEDVAIVEGPAGSGKTLVLVARARYLAESHPEWNLQVVVYNKLLAKHLGAMLMGIPNVRVSNFAGFSDDSGHRISMRDPLSAADDLVKIKNAGVDPDVDALFIDEWQDFDPSWLEYCLLRLIPGRGGALLAGDAKQCIYQDAPPYEALDGHQVHQISLTKPYRSTRQILTAVDCLDDTFEIEGLHEAPEGEPVDLIRGDSWDDQAEVIAWEIYRFLESGERVPGDIGVLCAQRKAVVNRLESALTERAIPFTFIDGTALPDPNTVSLLTVHQSKGYEFDVVILMGLEALPKPGDDSKSARRRRLGYVGPTRARDQLIITYTRQNQFVESLQALPEEILRVWTYPDDYEISTGEG